MDESFVKTECKNAVARITLNRPDKRNALTSEFIAEITRTVQDIADDGSVRLLILAASGTVFCAGMDLKEMQQRAGDPNATRLWQQDTQGYRDLLVALLALRIPTVALVAGSALAGGLGLVLACDIVLASETAFFALPEPRRGISAAVVAPLLIYRIGHGAAAYVLLSGEIISAADAFRIGLCHEVVADDKVESRAADLSASILSGAPSSLAITKRQMAKFGASMSAADGSAQIAEHSYLIAQLNEGMRASAAARETADAREGLAAFLEKRKPAWDLGSQ